MIALGLAHLLNYKLRASTFWRTVILTPYATSVASAALVFALVFRAGRRPAELGPRVLRRR